MGFFFYFYSRLEILIRSQKCTYTGYQKQSYFYKVKISPEGFFIKTFEKEKDMDLMFLEVVTIITVFGLLAWGLISLLRPRKYSGTLVIDHSDFGEPHWFVELSEDPGLISKRKQVSFKIEIRNYISQE